MTRPFAVAIAFALLVGANTALAQRSTDSSAFMDVRPDGNGVAELRRVISLGFSGQSASSALTAIADQARLNLTFNPRLPGLDTRISIAPHDRTVAVALLEVTRASRVVVRVSLRGELVVVAAPNEVVSRRAPEMDTSLSHRAVALPLVRTEAERNERRIFETSTNVGAVSVTGRELRSSPSFVEPDVLRSVQLLPGIEVRSDWTSGFNVHGGEADQSLVMIDGFPIYNPYHLGGLFSTFIDPTVGGIELRKGALPVRYGGRLSGALDVVSAEPTSSETHGTVDVSLLSSTASVGRRFANDAGAWMIAARRTYADVVSDLYQQDMFPYHFRDVQGRLTYTFSNGTRFALTAYDGLDIASPKRNDDIHTAWGNGVAGVSIARTFGRPPRIAGLSLGDSVTAEQRLSVSRFSAHAEIPNNLFHVENSLTEARLAGSAAMHHARSTTTVGYELLAQRLRYHGKSGYERLSDIFPFDSLEQRADVASAFVNHLWRPTSKLLLEGGLRVDAIRPLGWSDVSPRLSAKYFVRPNLAVTAGGGAYSQWMHSLGREEEPIQPLQFWVGSDSLTPVSYAHDVLLGLEHWFTPSRLLHVETFYKKYDKLLVPNAFNDSRLRGDEFTPTTGTSYGVDFLLRQLDGGRFSGWIAYTYAFNTRVGPDGTPYFPTQDRRHNVNLVGSWRRGAYTLGMRANVATGFPHTPQVGAFIRDRYDPVAHRWVPEFTSNDEQTIAGERGSVRLPLYTRIDVSANRTGKMYGASVTPYMSIVNLLNAHNTAAYLYSFSERPERATFPNLPFAPTVGVKIAY